MEITLFTPYPKQKEFIKGYADTDQLFGVAVAPRGSGKTLLAINLFLYWLLGAKKQKGGWVAPTFSQAKSVFDIIVVSFKELILASNRMETTITLINGSTIKFLSSDAGDSIRGFRFTHLVIDEMAFVKESVLNQAILPTLNPSGRKCLMISTPRGKNHLYTWFNKEDVYSMKFTLPECPYVKTELIEEARASLPVDIFRQEYLAEFVDSSNDVFTNIDQVSIVSLYDTSRKVDAFIGVDTGITDDFSVLTIMSPIGRVLWVETLNNLPLQEIAQRFTTSMSKFNIIGGNIETNGIGKGMYDLIIPKFRRVKAFTTTQESKSLMVRKLLADIESNTIEIPTLALCPALHRELGTFTYKMSNNGRLSFGHMPGGKDDHVLSLLMANYARNQFMERSPIRIKSIRPNFG